METSSPQPRHQQLPSELIRDALRTHGSFRFRALGGSMMPVVRHGEEIFLAPQDPDQARPGDILFFVTVEGHYLGHRFLGWVTEPDGRRFLQTKGDTLPYLDPLHPPENLLGRVAATRRKGKKILIEPMLGDRLLCLASRVSAIMAGRLLHLSKFVPGPRSVLVRHMIRYLTCGPVFVLGWILQLPAKSESDST